MIASDSVCADASVFIASLRPDEPFHREAAEFVVSARENQTFLVEPDIVVFEVSSVLHRKVLWGEMKAAEAEEAMGLFYELPLLLQWQQPIFSRAFAHARKFGSKSISDSLYVAVAESRGVPLVTLDDQLLKRGRSSYSKIMTPRSFLMAN